MTLTKVSGSLISDNAVGLSQLAGGTDGNLITYDGNGDPVAVATGTSGHVLTSAGAGATPVFADATTVYRNGEIIENLELTCTGQQQTVLSGTYTAPTVSAVQTLTTSYVDATGSALSYTAPTGATRVIYDFGCLASYDGGDAHSMTNWKLFLDNVEVTAFRRPASAYLQETFRNLRWTFLIGGTANAANGVVASWTSAKAIKLQARESSSSSDSKLHTTVNWEGAADTTIFVPPTISIKAIK
tara:strand:+ start:472 stop:1200 length:729 start_codon:yes stop_codon:yes gene_type:complete